MMKPEKLQRALVLFPWPVYVSFFLARVDGVEYELQIQITQQVTWHSPSPGLQFPQPVQLLSSSTCECAPGSSRVRGIWKA